MKEVTRELIKFYKPLEFDWLNYKITRQNPITFHHIIKAENGGGYDLDNGALLSVVGHQYIHLIEYREIKIYITLNKMFELINKQRKPPTEEQRQIIEYLLKQFEEIHKNDKNCKGKKLIKYEYTKRGSY